MARINAWFFGSNLSMNARSSSSESVDFAEAAFTDAFMCLLLHVACRQAAGIAPTGKADVRAAKWPGLARKLNTWQRNASRLPTLEESAINSSGEVLLIQTPMVLQTLAHCRIKRALSWKNARVSSVQMNPRNFATADSS